MVESKDHQYGEKKGRLGVFSGTKKDRADGGRRGTFGFITLRIPDTSGICGLAIFLPKFILLIPKPLLGQKLSLKDIQS